VTDFRTEPLASATAPREFQPPPAPWEAGLAG